jgi:eukaryotic-like serine/threonine-protein kinase
MHQRRQPLEPLRLGPFQLDLRARELRKNGEPVRLQDKPFELLIALTEKPGEVVTREDLRHRLWPSDTFVVFDDGLNTAIRKVREALGDSAEAPQYIQTVPRRGYRYIGPLEADESERDAPEARAAVVAPPALTSRAGRRPLLTAIAAVATLTGLAISVWLMMRVRAPDPGAVIRFEIKAPASTHFPAGWARVAVSPDGRQIAFCAVSRPALTQQIWVQSLDSSAVRPLPDTEGATDLAWSPDGRGIAFRMTNGRLRRHDLPKGISAAVAEAGQYDVGLDWSATAGVLFAQGRGHGLARVHPDGGSVEQASALDAAREETMHAWPHFLPDGRSFVYVAMSRRPEWSGLYHARIGESTRRLVRAGPYKARYVAPGVLVYSDGSRLLAQAFDPDRGTLGGATIEIAADVLANEASGFVDFSVSPAGVLAHARRRRPALREIVWVNRTGQRIASAGAPDAYSSFAVSPDGRWAILEGFPPAPEPLAPELWLLNLQSGLRSRITRTVANDEGGAWAPDSRRFVYARHPGVHRPSDISLKDLSDPEKDHLFAVDPPNVSKHPFDWSPDGRFVLYGLAQKGGTQDIWVLPSDNPRAGYPWLATPFDEAEARFSPDGRWVAYESNESGRREVFVRGFDPPGSRWQISSGGGTAPRWSADGRELYFVSGEHQLTAVGVRLGSRFDASAPRPLFELRRLQPNPQWPTPYAVSSDRQRFLIGAVVDEGGDSPMSVVLNWGRLLR